MKIATGLSLHLYSGGRAGVAFIVNYLTEQGEIAAALAPMIYKPGQLANTP